MKVFLYSVSVTGVSAVGAFVIVVINQTIANPGLGLVTSVVAASSSLLWGATLFVPMAIFYCLGVALVIGAIRKRVWWAGTLAGLLPSATGALFASRSNADSAYQGSPEQLAAQGTTLLISAVSLVIWCALAGTLLVGLVKTPPLEQNAPPSDPL